MIERGKMDTISLISMVTNRWKICREKRLIVSEWWLLVRCVIKIRDRLKEIWDTESCWK